MHVIGHECCHYLIAHDCCQYIIAQAVSDLRLALHHAASSCWLHSIVGSSCKQEQVMISDVYCDMGCGTTVCLTVV